MWPNPQETADLATFTEEILNGKLHFLWNVTFFQENFSTQICLSLTMHYHLVRLDILPTKCLRNIRLNKLHELNWTASEYGGDDYVYTWFLTWFLTTERVILASHYQIATLNGWVS